MSNPKVVSLQPDRKPSSAIPPIVNSLRQQARKRLLALVKELLDCTDDALFEMADRSASNADHNLYFDSMRQIRLHRGDVQKRFVDELNLGFDQAFAGAGRDADSIDDVDKLQEAIIRGDSNKGIPKAASTTLKMASVAWRMTMILRVPSMGSARNSSESNASSDFNWAGVISAIRKGSAGLPATAATERARVSEINP